MFVYDDNIFSFLFLFREVNVFSIENFVKLTRMIG